MSYLYIFPSNVAEKFSGASFKCIQIHSNCLTMQNEVIYINYWKSKVAAVNGWSDDERINDLDFENLANDIFNKTGVLLSITTLKRIWGKVNYQSKPSASTLNGLAKYVDYDSWREFKMFVDHASSLSEAPDKVGPRKFLVRPFLIILGTITMVIFMAWALQRPHKFIKAPVSKFMFTARKVTDGLPNSVVFDYNAKGLSPDSVILQQSWDKSRTEHLSVNDSQHTSIYYYPGYFWAKLIANDQIIKESPVFIQTQGWVGILAKQPIPAYLSKADIHLQRGLGISSKTFKEKSGSPIFNGQWVGFYNVKDFNKLNGGDFTLDVTLQNTSTIEESSCRKVRIDILGKRNAILIPLAEKGCVSDLDLFTSSEWLIGKNRDMSAFGCDFSTPQHVVCTVRNMVLKVYLNDHIALSVPITQTISEIAGICINFEGSGIVSKITLKNGRQTVLNDDFNVLSM